MYTSMERPSVPGSASTLADHTLFHLDVVLLGQHRLDFLEEKLLSMRVKLSRLSKEVRSSIFQVGLTGFMTFK